MYAMDLKGQKFLLSKYPLSPNVPSLTMYKVILSLNFLTLVSLFCIFFSHLNAFFFFYLFFTQSLPAKMSKYPSQAYTPWPLTLKWVNVSHRLGYFDHRKGMTTIPSQRGVMISAKQNTQTSQQQHFLLSFNCWLQLPASSRTHTKSELYRHCLPKLQGGHYSNMNGSKYGKTSLGCIEISN